MEVLPSTYTYSDNDRLNLEQLLDMFGSVVSLQEIASAYCQADRDLHTASDILCNLQGSTSEASDSSANEPENAPRVFCSSDNVRESRGLKSKPKKYSASVGTVSSVIGREYVRSRPPIKAHCKVPKPLKLNANEIPVSEIWDGKDGLDATRRETIQMDVAEFLFKMLGDGFHLKMEIIQDVVGQCGYDVKKSMEKLRDLSASAFTNCEDDPFIHSAKQMEENGDARAAQCQETSSDVSSASSMANSVMGNEVLRASRKDKHEVQNEILKALFNLPERITENPVGINQVKGVRRPRAFGQAVVGPPREPILETPTIVTRLKLIEQTLGDEDIEDEFELQKRAAKEYSSTMIEYYKSAVEAYIAEDLERADKLLEEGQFFMKKSREADEKAAQMVLQSTDVDEQVSIDLREFEPKDAIRLLKVQLTSLSGIPSIQYLKLTIGDKEKDTKARRRKRLIAKLFQMESITWKEEENGQAILIPVADINPKRLSFAMK